MHDATTSWPRRSPWSSPTLSGFAALVVGIVVLSCGCGSTGSDSPAQLGAPASADSPTLASDSARVLATAPTEISPSARATVAVYRGHSGPVTSVAWLDDGTIASGGSDGTVQIWNPTVGGTVPSARFGGHLDRVTSVTELADGRIASASLDGTVQVWDRADPATALLLFRQSGRFGRGAALDVIQLADGQVASTGDPDPITGADSFGGEVKVWDPTVPDVPTYNVPEPEGYLHYAGHEGAVPALVQRADGTVASAGVDGTVQIWNPDEKSSDSEPLPLDENGDVDPADLVARALRPLSTIAVFTGHTGAVYSVAQLADGRLASGGEDGTVRIWDPSAPTTRVVTFTGHTGAVTALVPLAGGLVASASDDGTVQIWDPAAL